MEKRPVSVCGFSLCLMDLGQLYHNTHLGKSSCYSKPRFDSTEFIILHFAGEVREIRKISFCSIPNYSATLKLTAVLPGVSAGGVRHRGFLREEQRFAAR